MWNFWGGRCAGATQGSPRTRQTGKNSFEHQARQRIERCRITETGCRRTLGNWANAELLWFARNTILGQPGKQTRSNLICIARSQLSCTDGWNVNSRASTLDSIIYYSRRASLVSPGSNASCPAADGRSRPTPSRSSWRVRDPHPSIARQIGAMRPRFPILER